MTSKAATAASTASSYCASVAVNVAPAGVFGSAGLSITRTSGDSTQRPARKIGWGFVTTTVMFWLREFRIIERDRGRSTPVWQASRRIARERTDGRATTGDIVTSACRDPRSIRDALATRPARPAPPEELP